jgi:hypothetical protein
MDQKRLLCALLDGFAMSHRSMTRITFFEVVKKQHAHLKNKDLHKWFAGFMKRWSQYLCQASVKGLSFARKNPTTLKDVEDF